MESSRFSALVSSFCWWLSPASPRRRSATEIPKEDAPENHVGSSSRSDHRLGWPVQPQQSVDQSSSNRLDRSEPGMENRTVSTKETTRLNIPVNRYHEPSSPARFPPPPPVAYLGTSRIKSVKGIAVRHPLRRILAIIAAFSQAESDDLCPSPAGERPRSRDGCPARPSFRQPSTPHQPRRTARQSRLRHLRRHRRPGSQARQEQNEVLLSSAVSRRLSPGSQSWGRG